MLITCAHCGSSFSSKKLDTITKNTNGSFGVQHSPGCMKTSRVHVSQGRITKIVK